MSIIDELEEYLESPEDRQQGPRSPLAAWIVLGAVLLGVYLALTLGTRFYTDWLWFTELGFESVYLTTLTARVGTFVVFGLAFFVVFLANMLVAHRFAAAGLLFAGQRQPLRGRWARWILLGVALFLSWIMGLVGMGQWETVLRYLNQQPFELADPIFSLDLGFYVFTFPLYQFLQSWVTRVLILTLMGIGSIYVLAQLPDLQEERWELDPTAGRHLAVVGGFLFLAFAWGYRLDMYELLYSPRGAVFGAGYADIHAQLPALRVLFWITTLIAVAVWAYAFTEDIRFAIGGVGLWVVAAVLLGNVYPGLVQTYQVQPNELARERSYIEHNIAFTQQAYDLHEVQEQDFDVQELTARILSEDQEVVDNVRLWDYRPLLQTYRQIQEIRTYYAFNDVDIDRYTIDGRTRQVTLSARELSHQQLQSPTWVNRRLEFTHGYGVVVNDVRGVTPEGLPQLLIKDIPPQSEIDLSIERPQIYYGELTNDYVFVNTGLEEFDYPQGERNVYTSYEGSGGVPLESLIDRIAFALRLGDVNVLISQYISPASRAMFYRNIHQRVRQVAPFLRFDGDPYLVIQNGKLYWIQDAYTTTDRYPYSQPSERGFNYIRNSVKIVIDAYEGSMRFYVVDPEDPMIQTYVAIFPELFLAMEEMPEGLRQHMRYPEDLLRVQASIYQKYHMEDVNVFYNQEDLWTIPREIFAGNDQPVEPYYVTLRLVGEEELEFVLIQPFTPTDKNNMIAWMAGRSDPEHYGELIVYQFPKQKLVFGPLQIESRIDQQPEISEQLSLWSQRGSRVIRGNLLVIPIGQSLLYVEPIYLLAETGELPELKRVVLASGDKITMQETLEQSVVALLGEAPPLIAEEVSSEEGEVTGIPSQQVRQLIEAANDHYNKAQELLRQGEWAGFGEELQALQESLDSLQTLLPGTQSEEQSGQ